MYSLSKCDIASGDPIEEGDQFQNKKRHIGNNYVTIVFCDSLDGFDPNVLSGQFHFVVILIFPRPNGYFHIHTVLKNENVPKIGLQFTIVHQDVLSKVVREIAIRYDLSCRSLRGLLQLENWMQRLTNIRQTIQKFGVKGEEGKEKC